MLIEEQPNVDEKLSNAPCGYLSFTDEGQVVEVNATLGEWLGWAPHTLPGTKVESLLTISSRIFYQTHFFPLLALRGNVEEIFLTLRTRNGDDIPVLAYAVRKNRLNECIVVTVHQREKYEEEILTAKRTAEEALRKNEELLTARSQLQAQTQELDRQMARMKQKNRELLQVTHILFHDLREPLRKIEMFGDVLSESDALNGDGTIALARINSACHRMNVLLRALQEFVAVESIDEPLAQVDLNALARDAYREARRAHADCESDLESDDLPKIEGYPHQLQMMFRQLMDNSFKFRKPDQQLKISLSGSVIQENSLKNIQGRYRYNDFAQIFFADNGLGIPSEYHESVFDLLKKLDTRSSQPGCGLAICRKVAENHYGSISVIRHSGEGTTFKILLPVRQD